VASHPGDRIDFWYKEVNTSGGIPITEREIGALFTDEMLDQWDGIIGWRLDRLFRDQLDYLLWVRDIGEKYGKFVIDAEDGTDSSTAPGRRILNQRAEAAQYERERASERRSLAAVEIRYDGRYGGGLIPFGLMKEKRETGEFMDNGDPEYAYWLIKHPEYAKEARAFIDRILAGESANSVCMDLNARHVPTSLDAQRIIQGKPPRGNVWSTNQLLTYLRSPALKGYVLHYPMLPRVPGQKHRRTGPPEIVYGPDGLPVRRAAIIDDDTWDDLQRVIGKKGEGRKTGRRANAATLLLGIALCRCGGSLHSEPRTRRPGGEVRFYYGCERRHYHGCTARLIPMNELDERINRAWIVAWRDYDVIQVKPSHDDTRERQLKKIGQAIIDLETDRYAHGIIRPNHDELVASLKEQEAEIRSTPPPESVEEETPTGETIGELYERSDLAGRRSLMQQIGFTFRVYRDAGNELQFSDFQLRTGVKFRVNLPEGFNL
jgi:site-specific DNA recombinase